MSNQPHPNEQLASLLIDGRLTGADLAAANERLASDTEFADEVAALRAQRELFGALPKYATPADFSDRALEASVDQVRAIVGELNSYKSQQSVESAYAGSATPGSLERNSAYTWRTAIMAVASLAGMILLTLFVFPQAFNGTGTVASVEKSGDLSSRESMKMDHEIGAPPKSDRGMVDGMADGIVGNDDQEEATDAAFDDDFATPGKGGRGGGGGFGGGGVGGGMGGVAVDATADSRMKKQVTRQQERVQVANSIKTGESELDEEANRQQMAANKSHTLPGAFSGTPMKLPMAKNANTAKAQSPSVEQIWYVDMNNIDQPLETVGKVLLTNSIDVQLDNQPMTNVGRQSFQVKKLNQPFEALYVNATQSQMKQALISLSGQAEISSMPLALNAPTLNAPNKNEASYAGAQPFEAPNNSIAGAGSEGQAPVMQQQSSALPESIKFNDRNKSLAQQLVRTPLNRSRSWNVPPIPSSNDPALEALEEAEKRTNEKAVAEAGGMGLAPPETISKSVPAQALPTQSARAVQSAALPPLVDDEETAMVQSVVGPSSPVSDEQIAPWFGAEDDQQLRQYLLLVRTPDNSGPVTTTPARLNSKEPEMNGDGAENVLPAEAKSDQK